MGKISMILWLPLSWLLWIMYFICKDQKKLLMDLDRFRKVHYGLEGDSLGFWKVYQEFIGFAEFRSVFWFRCGRYSKLVSWLFPKPELQLSFDCRSENVGGGFLFNMVIVRILVYAPLARIVGLISELRLATKALIVQ